MRVIKESNSVEKHWLYCEKERRIIHINATGARKVASV